MLVHNASIAADAWMSQEKKLEEFELFKTPYAATHVLFLLFSV